MAITLNGTRITVEYLSGEPKGNSVTNSYMFSDIVAASDASGWNPAVTRQGNSYFIPYSLYILGENTWFGASHYTYDYDTTVYFENNDQSDQYIFYSNGSHIRFGNDYRSSRPSVFIVCSTSLASEKTYLTLAGDVRLYNTSISRARYPGIYGNDTYIAYIMNCQFQQAYWGLNYNNRTYIDGLKIYGNYYQLKLNSPPYYNNNISLYFGSIAMINDSTTPFIAIFKNVKIGSTSSADTLIRNVTSNNQKHVYLLDCDVDFDRMRFYGSTSYVNSNTFQYLQTSLNVNIVDENGSYTDCSINVYAVDASVLYSADVSSGNLTDIPLTYAYKHYYTNSGIVTQTDINHQPLKIEISKDGYDTLTLNNINISKGQPTHIFGTMVPKTYPIYYQQQIDGSIILITLEGLISQSHFEGIINSPNIVGVLKQNSLQGSILNPSLCVDIY